MLYKANHDSFIWKSLDDKSPISIGALKVGDIALLLSTTKEDFNLVLTKNCIGYIGKEWFKVALTKVLS